MSRHALHQRPKTEDGRRKTEDEKTEAKAAMMDEEKKQKAILMLLDMVDQQKLKMAVSLALDIVGTDKEKKHKAMRMLLCMIPKEKLQMAIPLASDFGGQECVSMAASSIAAQESCEEWRMRGNQAYAKKKLVEAEDHYTRGLKCVSPSETNKSCLQALVLCYSNRAATRMALGRVKEALDDCMVAASMDPSSLKIKVRTANCYLALGEIDNAMKKFWDCLLSVGDLIYLELDQRKLYVKASDGLDKAEQASDCLNRSTQLLRLNTRDDVAKALEFITKGLSISPYSDNFIRKKAEALLMLRKYDEVIQLCKSTSKSARKSHGDSENLRFWRRELIAKSYFYPGRLKEALRFLQKFEKDKLAVIVGELLSHKASGNEAFQAGRYLEAVKHYTAALACSVDSHPFAAICFCNRAAAYQRLGQITDAIADCSSAIALDSSYQRAVSRRAELHEMIRAYEHAVADLQRLASLLKEKEKDKSNQHGANKAANELEQVYSRLATMEQEARGGAPLNMYMILGIDTIATAVEVKKAYRKAALRHHPDKAGQFLARNEANDNQLYMNEIYDKVSKDADILFKMIGEAYAVLSNPGKRSKYDDAEEERDFEH